jgi:anthranilate phosphoribosyltransferase
MQLPVLTDLLRQRRELDAVQVAFAASALSSPEVPDGEKADFLSSFSDKGESAAEIAGLAKYYRALALDPGLKEWAPKAVDIVGTGGDHAGGFNISSMVVLVLSCLGVPVMKHGNRGVTSKCGSADLFAAMGYDLNASPETLRAAMSELGYVFLFAPSFHPAFKHIGPVRKALASQGRRTVFNILGPLINPGHPTHLFLGVYASPLVDTLAEALHQLETSSGLVVHGEISKDKGIDEMTTATPNRVRGFGSLSKVSDTWNAEDFGLTGSPFSDLKGGDLQFNLATVEALLSGMAPRGLEDSIVLNAAVCLWIGGRVACIEEGLSESRECLRGGAVRAKIAATREFFASRKHS